jgi:hypothetical protein
VAEDSFDNHATNMCDIEAADDPAKEEGESGPGNGEAND